MIRIAILAIAVIFGAVMFLPETVAMSPDLDSVIGAFSTDLGNIRDGVIDTIKSAVSNAFVSVSDSVSSTISDTLSS